MTKTKNDGNSKTAQRGQPFDIELFEKEHYEYVVEERLAAEEARIRERENDPELMANEFLFENLRFKSDEEKVAYDAEKIIQKTKQKIRELQEEIVKQEEIINSSNRTIQKYKRQVQTEKSSKRGRRARSEDRERVVRKFIMKWVASLKDALEVKSCGAEGGLAKVVSSTQERNWRRWLKGDAIPSYATFNTLLDSKITGGKYAGERLCNVPVTPTHNQILTLLQFM